MKNSDEEKAINPVFIGNFDNFYTYLNDYVKNKVPYLTRQYKNGSCELCGKQSTLEAAHLRGQDRRFFIKKAFDVVAKLIHDDVYQVDLNAFALRINQIHSDPNNFHFLCHECHKKYDAPNSNIKESDFNRKFDTQTTSTKNTTKGEKMIKTTDWPFKKNKSGAINFCSAKGIRFEGNICLAAIAKTFRLGHEVYWADINVENLDEKEWVFLLNNQYKKVFHIVKIPAKKLTPDLRRAYWNKDKWDINIRTDNYREIYTNFDFKPYVVCDIPYTQDDINKFD